MPTSQCRNWIGTNNLVQVELAGRFLAIAKETKCLDDPACERLDEMRRDLDERRPEGMTDKNIAFIRQVLTPGGRYH